MWYVTLYLNSVSYTHLQVQKNIKAIKDGLKLRPGSKIIPFSAETKQGKDEIWALMDELTGAVPAATDELKA